MSSDTGKYGLASLRTELVEQLNSAKEHMEKVEHGLECDDEDEQSQYMEDKEQMMRLQEELAALEEEKDTLNDALDVAAERIRELEADLKGTERALLENENLRIEKENLHRRILVLKGSESELSLLKTRISELEGTLSQLDQSKHEIEDLKDTLAAEKDANYAKIETLELKLAEARQECNGMREKLAEAEKRADVGNEGMQADMSALQMKAQQAEDRARQAEQNFSILKRDDERRKKLFRELQDKFNDTEDDLRQKLSDALDRANKAEQIIDEKRDETEKIEELNSTLNGYRSRIEELEKTRMDLLSRESELESQLESHRNQTESIEKRLELERGEKAEILDELQNSKKALNTAQEERMSLKAELQSLSTSVQASTEQEVDREQLKSQISVLRESLQNSEIKLKRLSELERENKELLWQVKMSSELSKTKPSPSQIEKGQTSSEKAAFQTIASVLGRRKFLLVIYVGILHALIYYLSTHCVS